MDGGSDGGKVRGGGVEGGLGRGTGGEEVRSYSLSVA